ncbi:hypothetical protein SCLCIDRAFT_1213298 [Scleroderma citrinum Foug A]|uniref:Uncharacterized protein n=1 Tax=Scleroderma citrinum Foug A TaxID=1036808 RepID=A0A0C3E946_9AGAM|nr:hypothetical protein SCLCIDRAFT_1213298 [Scleroderma citrinum Foug A]
MIVSLSFMLDQAAFGGRFCVSRKNLRVLRRFPGMVKVPCSKDVRDDCSRTDLTTRARNSLILNLSDSSEDDGSILT